jgi:cytochrome c peroxidase
LKGFSLFVGKAKCASCHSGNLFTDQEFHNIASPQTGPGNGLASPDDYGRFTVTQDFDDLYAFRTPPLRNVELTSPWFHSGAFNSLEEAVKHHIEPLESLEEYHESNSGLNLPSIYANSWSSRQFSRSAVDQTGASLAGFYTHIFSEQERIDQVKNTLDSSLQNLPMLTEREIDSIVDFLISLTDPEARDLSGLIPETVPSGLISE